MNEHGSASTLEVHSWAAKTAGIEGKEESDGPASRLALFFCARPPSSLMITAQKAEAMNEEMDREWGPEAVRLWKEWVDLSDDERVIRERRLECLDLSDPTYLAWQEESDKVCKAQQEKWAACRAAMNDYRKKSGLPPFPFCPR